MNYRHQYHAGNFADVMKHAFLVRLIRAMQLKEKGFLLLDTHAGRGEYDLDRAAVGDTRARLPEWPEGIGRLWSRTDAPAPVADYLELVRSYDRSRGNLERTPRFYPGSPRLAAAALRTQDRMALWELQPAECAALRAVLGGPKVSIEERDGYGALRACLPPAERRALVLIDPPFEAENEWERIAAALKQGLQRLPDVVAVVWYPLTERARPDEALEPIKELGKPALIAELIVDPTTYKMTGCGLLIVNPPWQFDREAEEILGYLGPILHRGKGGGVLRWLVNE